MTKHELKVGHQARVTNYEGFNPNCNHMGTDGVITSITPDGFCDLKTEKGIRTGRVSDLEPIPSPKDPFAPGKYVTCTKKSEDGYSSSKYSKIAETYLVSSFHHHSSDWFCARGNCLATGMIEELGHRKEDFRAATPEEIAAYKAKYEQEDLIGISKEDADHKFSETFYTTKTYTLTPYIKPETVMIKGVEYIMTENV